MDIAAILLMISFLIAIGAVLFFIASLFFKTRIESSSKVEKSSYYMAVGVLSYFALISILMFNGQKRVAIFMLIVISAISLGGAFFIKKDHE